MRLPMTASLGRLTGTTRRRGRVPTASVILVLVGLLSCVAAQAALAIPNVKKVTPKEGPASGGTEVTITGTGFNEVTGVRFGTTAAIKYTVRSSEEIKAEAPTHVDGTIDIRVTSREGESETKTADHYTFTGALPKAPENISLPELSPANPIENSVESVTTGTWTGLPSTYSYQWLTCIGEVGCEKITNGTSSTYDPPYKYVGETLEVSVRAENAGGSSEVLVKAATPVASNGVIEYATGFDGLKGIASGPEEHMWFASTTASASGLGQMTTSGTILDEYTLSKEAFPEAIAEGSDHNMWFTEWNSGKIGKITPSGTVTEYSLPSGREPYDIVKGPDGDMWFTEQGQGTSWGKIGKISTSGSITEYSLPETENEPVPVGITAGPEESLWFTLRYEKTTASDKIDKITTSGKLTEYALPKCGESRENPEGIAEGPEGDLWYSDVTCDKIGKMTPSGTITEYKAGSLYPRDIVAGPEGDMWYTSWGEGSHVTKMTTAGVISAEYALPSGSDPLGIAVGPNKDIWVAAGSEVATIEP